jgi:hypothetical protein
LQSKNTLPISISSSCHSSKKYIRNIMHSWDCSKLSPSLSPKAENTFLLNNRGRLICKNWWTLSNAHTECSKTKILSSTSSSFSFTSILNTAQSSLSTLHSTINWWKSTKSKRIWWRTKQRHLSSTSFSFASINMVAATSQLSNRIVFKSFKAIRQSCSHSDSETSFKKNMRANRC